MVDHVELEDAVIGYYDTQEEARLARDRWYGPPCTEEELQRTCDDALIDRAGSILPLVQRSRKRPGKFFVRFDR